MSWKCPTCRTINPDYRDRCKTCDDDKDNYSLADIAVDVAVGAALGYVASEVLSTLLDED